MQRSIHIPARAVCILLALGAGVPALSQHIPPVPKPTVIGAFCPFCNEYIHGDKMPSACPHCRRSFTQKNEIPPAHGKPRLKPIDPFGDYLFYDVPIVPEDGKLKPKHLDPEGLAAKAEAWGKEMKQVDEQTRKKQQAQAESFEREKQALLDHPRQKLANPYANDPNIVDLRGIANPTPDLLRKNEPAPAPPKEFNPLAGMSDERLERKREALSKALSEIQKLQLQNVEGFNEAATDAAAGKDAAWGIFKDAGTTVALGTLKNYAKTASDIKAVDDGAAGADAIGLAQLWGDVDSGKTSAGDAIAQVAPIAAGLAVESEVLGAAPGVAKLGADTGLLWTDYFLQAENLARREELRRQHEASMMRLRIEQQRVVEEQNRRKQNRVMTAAPESP